MMKTPRFGSHTSWKMTLAPILTPSSIPAAKPVMCPSGEQTSMVSPESSPKRPARATLQAISVLRQCITPLGDPVVPEVNMSTAISSAGRAPMSPAGEGGRRSSEDSNAASKPSGPSPSTTRIC